MNISRLLFYAFIAYIIYMFIGYIIRTNEQDRIKQQDAVLEGAQQKTQQPNRALKEIDKYMREGLLAMQKGNADDAEKQFLVGRSLAKSQEEQEFFNHFTMMLVNIYLKTNALEKANLLLKEAENQPNIDTISYYNQLIILYEKQGKLKKMCHALLVLDDALSSLDCKKYAEDIGILEAQKDDKAIIKIFQKREIEAIVNCAGKRMIENKMASSC